MNRTLIYALAMAMTTGFFAAVEFAGASGTAQARRRSTEISGRILRRNTHP